MILDAVGSVVGDVASTITQIIVEWLVRRIRVSPNRWLNWVVRTFVYAAIFVPVAIAVVIALVYALVFVVNVALKMATW